MIDFFRVIFLQDAPAISLQLTTRSSSQQAEKINQLAGSFFIAAACMLSIVVALTVYVLIRFRQRKTVMPHHPRTPSRKWEMIMLGIPLLLVVYFFYRSLGISSSLTPAPGEKKADIIITGHQWWWQADYPAAGITTANEIHLPVGRPLLLRFESADVIHSWWVPQFGNKIDLIPHRDNFLSLYINKAGTYYGTCSEFCGAQHARMQIIVVAQPDPAYRAWLQRHQQPAAQAENPLVEKGARLFEEKTCAGCHRVKGTEADGFNGPDLTHLASRKTLLDGLLVNNASNLSRWIRHPQKIKPGCYMPDFALADSSVKAITAYLSSLK